jgi:hypothetical protein
MTVFVAILAGTELMGVVGAILAIPIAAGVQVVLTDLMDERRSRASGGGQVSGWRWMLNRGMGRANLENDDDLDTGEQVVNPEIYGRTDDDEGGEYADWGPSGSGDRTTDPDAIDTRAEATWPSNPWKGKVPSTRRPQAWRGMDRAETNATRSRGGRDTEPRRRTDTQDAPKREDETS